MTADQRKRLEAAEKRMEFDRTSGLTLEELNYLVKTVIAPDDPEYANQEVIDVTPGQHRRLMRRVIYVEARLKAREEAEQEAAAREAESKTTTGKPK